MIVLALVLKSLSIIESTTSSCGLVQEPREILIHKSSMNSFLLSDSNESTEMDATKCGRQSSLSNNRFTPSFTSFSEFEMRIAYSFEILI